MSSNIAIQYKNLFEYEIVLSKRRKKSISLTVKNGKIKINAPLRTPIDECNKIIEKRENWILNVLKKSEKKDIFNEEKVLFLGIEYLVKIQENPLLKDNGFCEKIDNYLYFYLPKNHKKESYEKSLKLWYIEQSQKIFNEKTIYFSKKYNFDYKEIRIKESKSWWGNCSKNNIITYNWKSILFPEEYIDYLVIHELSHTIEKNHSKSFWKIVEDIIPNCKEIKKNMRLNT